MMSGHQPFVKDGFPYDFGTKNINFITIYVKMKWMTVKWTIRGGGRKDSEIQYLISETSLR
jgi:hypothetical protein